jgi:hypothetical protein
MYRRKEKDIMKGEERRRKKTKVQHRQTKPKNGEKEGNKIT